MEYFTAEFMLRVFSFLIWTAALLVYIRYVHLAPDADTKNLRGLYSSIVMTWIFHVMVFYVVVIFRDIVTGSHDFTFWSNIIRVHGGISLIIYKLLKTAIGRASLQDY